MFKDILKNLDDREKTLLTTEVLSELLEEYHDVLREEKASEPLDRYAELCQTLRAAFNDEQKNLFADMEQAAKDNVEYMMRFAYDKGMYACYEQHFCPDAPLKPLQKSTPRIL